MRPATCVCAAVLAATLGHAETPGATRLVVGSGTIVDGVGVARFREPRDAGNGRIAFRATTELLVTTEGGSTRTLLASGAALPPPLDGSFHDFLSVRSTGDGLVVFEALVNAPDVDDALFALDGDRLTTIAAPRRTPGGTVPIQAFDLNPSGTAVYAVDAGVYRWTRAAGSERLADVDPSNAVHDAVVDANGAIAWITNAGAFYWTPTTGVIGIASSGQPSPYGGSYAGFVRADVAIDATSGVAFTAHTGSADAAFVWDPATGTTRVVMKVGDHVGGDVIERFERRLFQLPDRTVAFARVGRRRRYVAASGGALAIVDRPQLPAGPATTTSVDGLYFLDGDAVRRVARQGEPVGDVGVVSAIGAFAARGDTVAFVVDTADERGVLLRYRQGHIERVVKAGDTVAGVTVDFVGPFDVAGGTVALFGGSAFAVLRRGREPRTIAVPRTPAGGTGLFVDRLAIAGSSLVTTAFTDVPVAGGIYVSRRRAFVPYLEIGDTVPGFHDDRVSSFGVVEIDGRRRLFLAGLVGGENALFLDDGRRTVRLPLDRPDGAGPMVPSVASLHHGTVLVSNGDTVYRATRRRLRPAVRSGDATDAGVLAFADHDSDFGSPTFAATDRAVVFAADVEGGPTRAGLFERSLAQGRTR